MADYISVIMHIPLYSYHLALEGWWFVYGLPWPSAAEFFGSLVIFICLYPARAIMKAMLPEEQLTRRVYRRRKRTAPSQHEQQVGVAASTSSFINHL